jgi:hypothetical protein
MIMPSTDVCPVTFEASIEAAIQMLDQVFIQYIDALYRVEAKQAKSLLHSEGEATLKRKHLLELALLDGRLSGEVVVKNVPTMNLDYALHQQSLVASSDAREVIAFAIHIEKLAEKYFSKMCGSCVNPNTELLFNRLHQEQQQRILTLEDLYEQHFLTEN